MFTTVQEPHLCPLSLLLFRPRFGGGGFSPQLVFSFPEILLNGCFMVLPDAWLLLLHKLSMVLTGESAGPSFSPSTMYGMLCACSIKLYFLKCEQDGTFLNVIISINTGIPTPTAETIPKSVHIIIATYYFHFSCIKFSQIKMFTNESVMTMLCSTSMPQDNALISIHFMWSGMQCWQAATKDEINTHHS